MSSHRYEPTPLEQQMRDALVKIAEHPGCGDYYCDACPCGEEKENIARQALAAYAKRYWQDIEVAER